ncbi:MAG: hypothetical protein HY817_01035 [Candidatus Abawacabacteria bacterium]|nr:hypothetical protein [Candidatus Abawacabacteria bacterium]
MRKIFIILVLLLCTSSFAFAQNLPNLPGGGGAGAVSAPNVPGSPTIPNVQNLPGGGGQGAISAPGGLPGGAAGAVTGPGGLPGGATGATTAPSVYGQPNNQSSNTGSGGFLNIATPANHGLPGNEGLEPIITRVINNALNFIALVGIAGLIFASLQLFLAQGKADGIGQAKNNIFNLLLGFVIVLLAWSGVTIALRFLGF